MKILWKLTYLLPIGGVGIGSYNNSLYPPSPRQDKKLKTIQQIDFKKCVLRDLRDEIFKDSRDFSLVNSAFEIWELFACLLKFRFLCTVKNTLQRHCCQLLILKGPREFET